MAQENTLGINGLQQGPEGTEVPSADFEFGDSLFGGGDLGIDFGGDSEFHVDFSEPLGDIPDPDLDDIGDGELDLSIGSDDFGFEESDILESSDITKTTNEYYQGINEIMERMRPPQAKTDDKFTLNAADFPYLEPRAISALSKVMLDKAEEQKKLPENKRLDSEEAAEEIFDTLSELIPLSVSANYDNFIDMCARQYENFFKRASAVSTKIKSRFADIVDRKRLEEARLTCYINGYLWNQVSVFLTDANIQREEPINYMQNGRRVYNVAVIGPAMEFYNEHLQSEGKPPVSIRTMTAGDLFDCVTFVLNRENMMNTLHLSPDTITSLSAGELLRRYVLLEYNEGLFNWDPFQSHIGDASLFGNVNNMALSTLERVDIEFPRPEQLKDMNEIAQQWLQSNLVPMLHMLADTFLQGDPDGVAYTDSVTQELLYYIYLLQGFYVPAQKRRIGQGTWYDFLMGLSVYFTAMYVGAPYINPVMYYTPSYSADKQAFELHFTVDGQNYSVPDSGLLATVVGDNSKTYIYPSVHAVDSSSKDIKKIGDEGDFTPPTCVLLPLNTIYDELRSDARTAGVSSVKNRLDTSTEYVYTPSLLWVASRSYSSQGDIDSAIISETISNRTTNPLLDMLLNYTNKFEPEVQAVKPGIAAMGDGLKALYVREGSSPDPVLACVVDDMSSVIATAGTLGFDEEDGSAIMQYFTTPDDSGTLVSKNAGEYEVEEYNVVERNVRTMPALERFLDIPAYEDLGVHAKKHLRAVNQRLCKLNAIDYAEELATVRTIISRDLSYVVPAAKFDALLATKAIVEYEKYVQESGALEDTNTESLRELSKIVLGKSSPIARVEHWSDGCVEVFDKVRNAGDNTVKCIEGILDMYDVNVIALQGLAISNTTNQEDLECYMCLHCIPSLHRRLRDLEERMLMLRVLNEIGQDVLPILRRASPLYTAYCRITTSANIDIVEDSLKSGMKGGKKFDALPLTRKVLASEVGGSTPILKYFALNRNVHGIMSTAICSDDQQERELYDSFYHCLGLDAEGMPAVTELNEETFSKAPFAISINEACEQNRAQLIALIQRGILADTSARVDIHVIKAFDLLCTYGSTLFGIELDSGECEDFEDISEYLTNFYTYVGSFFINYCLVTGDSLAEVEGARNRIEAFRNDYSGFANSEDLLPLSTLELDIDMRGQWGDD